MGAGVPSADFSCETFTSACRTGGMSFQTLGWLLRQTSKTWSPGAYMYLAGGVLVMTWRPDWSMESMTLFPTGV